MRILVVEDDAVDRLAIRRALSARAELDDAPDAGAAVRLLSENHYDVALLDWFLPGGTGVDAFTRLREVQSDLPVVFLSAHGSEEVVLDAMKAGASDYVSKSAVDDRDRLWRVVESAVETRRHEREENERIANESRLRERLMGIASHDLKNPLSAVLQAAELLARSPRLEEREKRYVQHIKNSAERMNHLIVQLLDLTRVRLGGGLPLERQRVRVDQAVRQVADELKLAAPDRVLALELEEVELDVDPDRFGQVASNLLGNALKHSPAETPVNVWLRREPSTGSGGAVVLSVKNRGKPIPEEAQSLIFEPFVQYGDATAREGLGLGLYISREIVRAHGGVLTVSSDEHEGTCFTAKIPVSAR